MSVGPGSSTETVVVYVQLLDEGTVVFRPTAAVPLGEGKMRLLPTERYDPLDEQWEFPPGAVVRCERRRLDGVEVWVAVAFAGD